MRLHNAEPLRKRRDSLANQLIMVTHCLFAVATRHAACTLMARSPHTAGWTTAFVSGLQDDRLLRFFFSRETRTTALSLKVFHIEKKSICLYSVWLTECIVSLIPDLLTCVSGARKFHPSFSIVCFGPASPLY